jgi:hypothetical protein
MKNQLPPEIRQSIRGAQLSLLVMIITILGYAAYSSSLRLPSGSLLDIMINILAVVVVLIAGLYGRRQSARIKRYRNTRRLELKANQTVIKEEL